MVILIICGSKKQLCCYGEHFQQPAHNWLNLRYKSISEILTIKRYWNLIGWETFLAVTWQSDFPQECSFCRMLMNYKNFHFTKIPDKTNDVIFLKSPKTMFLGHFLPFLVIFSWRGFFFQKKSGSVTHKYIWESLLSSKKTNAPIPRKLTETEGRTEGQTEGPTDPIL